MAPDVDQAKKASLQAWPSAQGAAWGARSLLEIFGCCPRAVTQLHERLALGQAIQRLQQQRDAALDVIVDVEDEICEIDRQIAEKTVRRQQIVRLMKEGGAESGMALVSCCDATERRIPGGPPIEYVFEPRAVLQERLEETLQEVAELRHECAGAQRRSEAEARALSEAMCRSESQRILEWRAEVRDSLTRRFAVLLAGRSAGDRARVRAITAGWRQLARQHGTTRRVLGRLSLAMTLGDCLVVCFYGWRVKLLERRQRRIWKWKTMVKRVALRFVTDAEGEILRVVLSEWWRQVKLAVLAKHLDRLDRDKAAQFAEAPAPAPAKQQREPLVGPPEEAARRCCAAM